MKDEYNRDPLKKALEQLRRYEPEAYLWDHIEQGMTRRQEQDKLQAALTRLPRYEPRPDTWSRIEPYLPAKQKSPVYRLLFRAAAVAAIFAGLIPALQWLGAFEQEARVQLIYSLEEAPPPLPIRWEEDQAEIELIKERFAAIPGFAAADDHDRLLRELQELESAKAELEAAIEKYGINDLLAREMAGIEKERTSVLEEMASQI